MRSKIRFSKQGCREFNIVINILVCLQPFSVPALHAGWFKKKRKLKTYPILCAQGIFFFLPWYRKWFWVLYFYISAGIVTNLVPTISVLQCAHVCTNAILFNTFSTSTAPQGKTIKQIKVGYLLVKCIGHQQPPPNKPGFQRVQRTLRKILHLSLPPEKWKGKQTVWINSQSHPIRQNIKVLKDNCSTEKYIISQSMSSCQKCGKHFWCQVQFWWKSKRKLCNLVSYTRDPFHQVSYF